MRVVRVLGRTLAALLAAFALTGTGIAYWHAHGLLSGITVSRALGLDTPRSSGGSMNILLIGLDSRKDQDGNDLPEKSWTSCTPETPVPAVYNTNTLILVHIGADDRVGCLFHPRDDYVAVSDIKGYDHIKIKEAYGLTKAQTEQELLDEGITDPTELERRGRGSRASSNAARGSKHSPVSPSTTSPR